MLTENDVIEAVCRHFDKRGVAVSSKATTKQRGIDIVAIKRGATILIEAKGETTSYATKREGKPFTRNQCRHHVSVALFTAARLLQAKRPGESKRRRVAIALPDTSIHREMIASIDRSLRTLRIGVMWIGGDRRVRCSDPWLA